MSPAVAFRLLVLLAPAAISACQQPAPPRAPGPARHAQQWETHVLVQHPLVGRIFDVGSGKPIDATALLERAGSSHFVLLGEKHDNPDHHRLQAFVLQSMIDAGRRPTVGFEMLESGQQDTVNQVQKAHPGDPDAIRPAVGWDKSGWPDWPLYRPVFAALSEARLPILATNVPKAQVRLIVRYGAGAFVDGQMKLWGLDQPLPAEQLAALKGELRDSHCGMLPEKVVDAMVLAQRARDAGMADRMTNADGSHGVVLVAGAGHVRRDRGVPAYLALRRPESTRISIAFVEVHEGGNDPKDYDSGADLVWFTPRVDSDDPCAKFAEQMRR
ncbi:MAG: ChaN family lipoprotein [Deltaproteobacteria bacterium]|nr:ChaN family lipoprotein [Deltaproteobacteria bacterium]